MAELSEKDKRTLFGENYKEVLAQAELEGRVASVRQRGWAAEIESIESKKFSAVAVMIVGGLIALSNYFAVSGPSVMLVGLFGVALLLIGVGWYWRLWSRLRELKANPIVEEKQPPVPVAAQAPLGEAGQGEGAGAQKPQDHPPLEAAPALNP
jgi:hypothetical protein